MAQTDLEKLVVQLSADIRGYEKALQRAQAKTNAAASGIEGRFRKMNASVSKGLAGIGKGFGGGVLAGGIAGLVSTATISQIGQAIKSVADLADEAEKLGVKASDLQALQFVGRQNGVEADQLRVALSKLNLEVGEAQTKGNDLKKIFDANNLTFSTDPLENFRKVVDLIRNAKTEQDKAVIGAAAFGKAYADLIPLLNQGADAIRKGEQAARDAGGVISDELVARAREFDDKWTAAWDVFAAQGKSAILTVLGLMQDLQNSGFIADLAEAMRVVGRPIRRGLHGLGLPIAPPAGDVVPELTAAQAGQQKLLELTQERLHLETEIRRLQADQADPSLISAFEAQLSIVRRELNDLKRDLLAVPSFNDQGQGGRARAVPFTPATVLPNFGKAAKDVDELGVAVKRFVDNVVEAESGGDARARNPNSTATGVGQFIEETWLRLFRENFPDRAASLSQGAILALRTDAATSRTLIEAYARENAAVLQKAGVSVNEASLQLAHFLGAGGALKVLQAKPGTPIQGLLSQGAIDANPKILGGGQTVDDVIRYAQARAGLTAEIQRQQQATGELGAAQQEEIARMQLENTLFGQTSIAAEKMRIAYELTAEAKRTLGRELLPDEIAKIQATAQTMAELKVQHEQLDAAQRRTAESAQAVAEAQARAAEQAAALAQEFQGAFTGALKGFISDLVHGESVTDALTSAVQRLADQLLDVVLNNLFASLLGGGLGGAGGGGIFASLFHKGAASAGTGGPGRRVSPALFAGAPRYHQGGFAGLKPGEIPAILKRGEAVGPAAVEAAARRLTAIAGGRMAGGSGGQQAPVNVTTKVVNRFDAGSFLSESLASPQGERALLNFVRARPASFRAALQG